MCENQENQPLPNKKVNSQSTFGCHGSNAHKPKKIKKLLDLLEIEPDFYFEPNGVPVFKVGV